MRGRFAMIVQLVILMLVIHGGESEGSELVYNYYETTCPFVEDIVRNEMLSIFTTDITAPAAFLRLLFHDCQVQGCDASILLASTDSEIHASRNLGIRKLEAINQIKSRLEAACPGQVSCADIIALAAKNSVTIAGGPFIRIPLGRKDSNTSSSVQADAHLPSASIDVDQLISLFATKGMNLQETVAILGAHTLGAAHCVNVMDRFYRPKPTDHMDIQLQIAVRAACANTIPAANMTLIPNDATPTIFDASYYFGILAGRGLFSIDSSLSADPRTMVIAAQFAANQHYFFRAFSSAFIKLSSANVLTGNMGQVRKQCNRVN